MIQTCLCAAPSVTACAAPPSSGRKAFVLTHKPTCLSLWERCRAATERAGSLFEGAGLPPCGKTEGVLQIGKIRMRFALTRTCQCAALSVICFANASSPKGRAKKAERTAHMPHQAIFFADLPACCSFRHGLRRATFLREEGFFLRTIQTCLSLWERCRAATERAFFLKRRFFPIKKHSAECFFLSV